MPTMSSTEQNNTEGFTMNEKIYKSMTFAGVSNITIGIIVAIIGVATGILAIISGARLLKDKKQLTF